MVNVLPRSNFWGRGSLTFDYFKNVSLEGSTPLSHNSIENNEKAAAAISDVNDIFLFYAEVTKVSLNLWFKLTVTKLNFLTNSLTTLFSVLVKLNHEGRKLISKAENPDSEILS